MDKIATNQISPKKVSTGDSMSPMDIPSITKPRNTSHTSVARYNVKNPIAYGMLTKIMLFFLPIGSENSIEFFYRILIFLAHGSLKSIDGNITWDFDEFTRRFYNFYSSHLPAITLKNNEDKFFNTVDGEASETPSRYFLLRINVR